MHVQVPYLSSDKLTVKLVHKTTCEEYDIELPILEFKGASHEQAKLAVDEEIASYRRNFPGMTTFTFGLGNSPTAVFGGNSLGGEVTIRLAILTVDTNSWMEPTLESRLNPNVGGEAKVDETPATAPVIPVASVAVEIAATCDRMIDLCDEIAVKQETSPALEDEALVAAMNAWRR